MLLDHLTEDVLTFFRKNIALKTAQKSRILYHVILHHMPHQRFKAGRKIKPYVAAAFVFTVHHHDRTVMRIRIFDDPFRDRMVLDLFIHQDHNICFFIIDIGKDRRLGRDMILYPVQILIDRIDPQRKALLP